MVIALVDRRIEQLIGSFRKISIKIPFTHIINLSISSGSSYLSKCTGTDDKEMSEIYCACDYVKIRY